MNNTVASTGNDKIMEIIEGTDLRSRGFYFMDRSSIDYLHGPYTTRDKAREALYAYNRWLDSPVERG